MGTFVNPNAATAWLAKTPLPTPDPRGGTFNERLPPQIGEAQEAYGHFGADQIPANEFLRQRGYNPEPGAETINPMASYPLHQAFGVSDILPPSYGAGKYTIYTPNHPQSEAMQKAALQRLISALNKHYPVYGKAQPVK